MRSLRWWPYLCYANWTSPIYMGVCTCAYYTAALIMLIPWVCNCPVFTEMYIQQIGPYMLKNKAVVFVLFCQGYTLVMM